MKDNQWCEKGINIILILLIAQENFSKFNVYESLKSYFATLSIVLSYTSALLDQCLYRSFWLPLLQSLPVISTSFITWYIHCVYGLPLPKYIHAVGEEATIQMSGWHTVGTCRQHLQGRWEGLTRTLKELPNRLRQIAG